MKVHGKGGGVSLFDYCAWLRWLDARADVGQASHIAAPLSKLVVEAGRTIRWDGAREVGKNMNCAE